MLSISLYKAMHEVHSYIICRRKLRKSDISGNALALTLLGTWQMTEEVCWNDDFVE